MMMNSLERSSIFVDYMQIRQITLIIILHERIKVYQSITKPTKKKPCKLSQSPDGSSSLPSLCSPNSLSQEDEIAFMSTNLCDDDIDLSMRAPYIPMNESDDLPLLTEDLMWSAFSDELSLHKAIKEPSGGTIISCTANIMDTSNMNDTSASMRKTSLSALLSGHHHQANDTFKELQKQFANGLTGNGCGGKDIDIDHCGTQKLSNGYGNVIDASALANGTATPNGCVVTNVVFNRNHNAQAEHNVNELMKTHDQEPIICDDSGINDTDPITPLTVEEYDDDSFPKSCKCLHPSHSHHNKTVFFFFVWFV